MPHTADNRKSRSPTGCNATPIYVSLTPAERDQVVALANAERLTLGATARLLMLRGLGKRTDNRRISLAG
ncbi:hypothetical protein HKX42_00045 [Salinisphaera sp. USBA-960]|nr:hypothetical protein [Salifodinibacter halophilus]NNC25282.1 hypothetical protein [Salifodinibacter halophilus]